MARLVPHLILLCSIATASSCSSNALRSELEREILRLASLNESQIPAYLQDLDRNDEAGRHFADPATREPTLEFFAELTRSRGVAQAILENAERYGVPACLAFALALEESAFRVDAVGRNADSVDRGLFQLNSKTFPKLAAAAFFDPALNAKYGLSHFQTCLRQGGNEVAALAMYNAGNGRVDKGATPRKTLDYIFRILSYEENIASLFAARVLAAGRTGRPAEIFAGYMTLSRGSGLAGTEPGDSGRTAVE
jgi:soluble lytic murein transglycosylase-like protein